MANPWDNDPIVNQPTMRGSILTDPYKAAAEGRANRGEGREDQRIDLTEQGQAQSRSNDAFNQASRLRNDYDASAPVKAYQTIIRQYGNGLSAAETAAGDQALINSYSQMLNPTSTVMLGEYQAAEQNDTTLARVQERLKREFGWDGAGRISPAARKQLLDEMQGITVAANRAYSQERERYRDLAQRSGFDPVAIVGQHSGAPFFNDIEGSLLARDPRTQSAGRRGEQVAQDVYRDDDGGLVGVVTDEGGRPPRAPAPTNPNGFGQSYVGQGLSGVNEGIASTLGAPVDLMTMGMNLVPQGLNALANTNIPQIDRPFLGSDWIKDQMDGWAIRPASSDSSKQFVRRAAQSVGSAAVPIGAAPGTMSRALQAFGTAAGGGIGAAAAQQAFPNNPAAEFAGEVLGSGLTAGGMFGGARRRAVRKAIEEVPSRDQLRDQASNLYDLAESRGIVAGPNVTGNLAGRFNDIASREAMRWPNGKVDPNYTRAGASLDMMDAFNGQSIDPKQIQVLRENLMDAQRMSQGKERRVARQMLDAFDEETIPLAPELADARRVSSRYLQSDEIKRARELADARASQFSGSGPENAIRTEFRKLDRGLVNGDVTLNPAAADAVRNVTRGTRWSNAMRNLGKLAPTGVVSGGVSAGVPFAIGSAVGGPAVGAAASGATMGLGAAARLAATRAAQNEVNMADVLARNGGALDLPPLLDPETERAIRLSLLGQSSQYIPR